MIYCMYIYRKDFNVMKLIDSFKTKGLLSFGNSTWITIEPCIINNCKLDAGTIVFDASICKVHEHVTSPGDLIVITDRSHIYFNCPYCGGSILPKDNEIESVDDLKTCDFDVVAYDFTDSSVFYELNEGAGKTVPYNFGLNLDTALLFFGSWRVDNRLSSNHYNNLSDVSTFTVNREVYSGLQSKGYHNIRYTPVDGIKGLYVKHDLDAKWYDYMNFAWLTKADVRYLNEKSKYGVILSGDIENTYKLLNPVLDCLKVISTIHEEWDNIKDIDYDAVANACNLSVDSFKNIYNTMLYANKSVPKRDCYGFLCDWVESNDFGHSAWVKTYSVTYFSNKTLSSGLEVEPFNTVLKNLENSITCIFHTEDGTTINGVSEFLVKDVDMTNGCLYKGDILLNGGTIIKNVSTSFSSFADDKLLRRMQVMGIFSRSYKQLCDKIDIDKLRHDLAITADTGGDVLDAYVAYADYIQFMDKHANDDINRFKLVLADGKSHLVSVRDNAVEDIDVPVVKDRPYDDKILE